MVVYKSKEVIDGMKQKTKDLLLVVGTIATVLQAVIGVLTLAIMLL